MNNIQFEARNKSVSAVRDSINYIAKSSNTKQECVNRLSDILPNELKIGFGSSHVWCSNSSNKRLFIIYFK